MTHLASSHSGTHSALNPPPPAAASTPLRVFMSTRSNGSRLETMLGVSFSSPGWPSVSAQNIPKPNQCRQRCRRLHQGWTYSTLQLDFSPTKDQFTPSIILLLLPKMERSQAFLCFLKAFSLCFFFFFFY